MPPHKVVRRTKVEAMCKDALTNLQTVAMHSLDVKADLTLLLEDDLGKDNRAKPGFMVNLVRRHRDNTVGRLDRLLARMERIRDGKSKGKAKGQGRKTRRQ